MQGERLYIVMNNIGNAKRRRRECRLTTVRYAGLIALPNGIIHHAQDRVMLIDIGNEDQVGPRMVSLGRTYTPLERAPIVI